MARSIDTLAVGDPTYIAPPTVEQARATSATALAKVQQDVAAGDPAYAASLYRAGERGGFTPSISYSDIASAKRNDPLAGIGGVGSTVSTTAEAQRLAEIAATNAATVAKQGVLDSLTAKQKAQLSSIKSRVGEKIYNSLLKVYEDNPAIAPDDALSTLKNDTKYNSSYVERFAGNQTLIASGKNPLTIEEYLSFEETMKEYATAYDMPALKDQGRLNTLIGQGLDAATASTVIDNVYSGVLKQKDVLDSFKKYYPELSTGDIVSSVLLGTKNKADVSILDKKITAAQIGGAAAAQGLTVGMGDATQQAALAQEYAASGVTQAGARTAYSKIATELPGLQSLGNIFGQQTDDAKGVKPGENVYTQAISESADIKGLASAQRTKNRLIQYGEDVFKGDTGIDARSFAGPTGQY